MKSDSESLPLLGKSIRDAFQDETTWGDKLRRQDAGEIARLLETKPPDVMGALAGLRELSQDLYGSSKRTFLSKIERQLLEQLSNPTPDLMAPLSPKMEALHDECLSESDLINFSKNLLDIPQHPAWLSRSGPSGLGLAEVIWLGTQGQILILPAFEIPTFKIHRGIRRSQEPRAFGEEKHSLYPAVTVEIEAARRSWLGLLLPVDAPRQTLLDAVFDQPAARVTESFQHLSRLLQSRLSSTFQPFTRPDLSKLYVQPMRQALERIRGESRLEPVGRDLEEALFVQDLLVQGPAQILDHAEECDLLADLTPAGASMLHGCLGLESVLVPNERPAPVAVVEHRRRFLGDYVFDIARLCASLTALGHAVRGGEAREWEARPSSHSERQLSFVLHRSPEQLEATQAALGCLEKLAETLAKELEHPSLDLSARSRAMRCRLLLAMARHFLVAVSMARSLEEATMLLGAGSMLLAFFDQGVRSRRPVAPSELVSIGLL